MTRQRQILPALTAVLVLLAACQGGLPSVADTPGLSVVTIGDSIPYAQEDCGGCTSFTTLYEEALRDKTSTQVTSQNLSTNDNLTGRSLVDRIKNDEPMRTAVAGADIVIVSIGFNDTPWNSLDDGCDAFDPDDFLNWKVYTGVCVVQLAQRHAAELDAIFSEIETLRRGAPTAVRVLTNYNDILGWQHAPPESTKPSIEVFDAFYTETCKAAKAHHAACIDVYHAFNGADGGKPAGDLLADNYTEPSGKGQQRIADLLLAAGMTPLSPSPS
jgi:lysophospholipase L1-like esterase